VRCVSRLGRRISNKQRSAGWTAQHFVMTRRSFFFLSLVIGLITGCANEPQQASRPELASAPASTALNLIVAGTQPCAAAGGARSQADLAAPRSVAVAPFTGVLYSEVDMASVVAGDLAGTGLFMARVVTNLPYRSDVPSQVDFQSVYAAGVDAVVLGDLQKQGNQYATRFYLVDTACGEQQLGFDMPAAPANQLRYVGHTIADLIYTKLTGISGYFNTQIAYVSVVGVNDARRWQLVVADSDGENPRIIAESKEILMSPAWSPDRSRLAYVGYQHGQSAIYIQDLTTGKLRTLVAEPGTNGAPAWSPDGTRLAVTLSFKTNPDIYVIDINSGARTRLTSDSAIDAEPTWSPDGQFIAFTSDRGSSTQIYRVPISGGPATQLTFEGKQNFRPEYSPDGKTLLLVNHDGSGYRIGLLDLLSGRLRLISEGPLDQSPSFAPNGAVVIYTASRSGRSELATVTTDGRIHRSIRLPGADVRDPAWSPYIK